MRHHPQTLHDDLKELTVPVRTQPRLYDPFQNTQADRFLAGSPSLTGTAEGLSLIGSDWGKHLLLSLKGPTLKLINNSTQCLSLRIQLPSRSGKVEYVYVVIDCRQGVIEVAISEVTPDLLLVGLQLTTSDFVAETQVESGRVHSPI